VGSTTGHTNELEVLRLRLEGNVYALEVFVVVILFVVVTVVACG
jgi:hypothetical protein